jgi:UDP-glucose-4-epimerase GalE
MSRGKVLVTGGAGYIGSHACKALAVAGYEPVCFDNLSIGNRWAVRWGPLERGDVLDSNRLNEALRAHRPVGVMHFAALALVGESVREPSLYWRTNIAGLVNVLDACRAQDIENVVFSSTCAVYGAPDVLPITEASDTKPINPYGRTKLAAEEALRDYADAYGLRYAILRYFNAAGADPDGEIGECRDVETHLVPLALAAARGEAQPLMVLGDDYPTPDGTAIRDYVHVSDLADAHVRALESLCAGVGNLTLNLGAGRGHSVREVLVAAERIIGRAVPHRVAQRRPGDPAELVADPTRAIAALGGDIVNRSNLDNIIATAWRWTCRAQRNS